MKLIHLISGTDVRGTALGDAADLSAEAVSRTAAAFGHWLSRRTGKETGALRAGVGMDSRLSGPTLKEAAIKGLSDAGVTVYDCGMASTPAMFMSTVTQGYAYDGAVMITASHLPADRNGMKFFTTAGGVDKPDLIEILKIGEGGGDLMAAPAGPVRAAAFMEMYCALLADRVRKALGEQRPLAGFRIIVDAGNGAGGFFVNGVLKPLGADTSGSQYLAPDGHFPHHPPNPEDREAMASICEAVRRHGADLGILFDADVDRAAAVDDQGNAINRNRMIALMAAIVLRENPGGTIVTDSVTSTGLAAFIESHGGVHHRFKRGYRNVINEAVRLNKEGVECPLAMETSGHAALQENYFLDDGAYLMVRVLIEMARLRREGKTFHSLLNGLCEPVESEEFRLAIDGEDFRSYGQQALARLAEAVKAHEDWKPAADNHEGVRINVKDGWFLGRLSLHDPVLPVNMESDAPGGVLSMARKLYAILKDMDRLDLTSLSTYIKDHG
jgi:phosphomannomutase